MKEEEKRALRYLETRRECNSVEAVSNFVVCFLRLLKAVVPHSSTLAWKISWTEEPGGLQSMGLLRVGHD